MNVLVTGGAGFIGSHVVDLLLEQGHSVRVFDALVEQVHQGDGPKYVPAGAEFVQGDVRDRDAFAAALAGMDEVVHLAAEVGVGQSMYEISRYVDANTGGTAVLLDILANARHSVRKLVVASSMSIYGEGAYECLDHGLVFPRLRTEEQLHSRSWEPTCPDCGATLEPVPTAESKPLYPSSVYAISKMDQELLCLNVAGAYGIDATALRFFNAYGPRQALSNPYTGVAAIFGGRLLNGQPPIITEDGKQRRDFIHVRDVARATVAALSAPGAGGQAINVGMGDPISIREVAALLAVALGREDIAAEVTGTFRVGDIRHCWADTTKARDLLGFEPQHRFRDDGITELVGWISTQQASDHVPAARAELIERGLTV